MADIKQAAQWMNEGKRVRLPRLSQEVSLGIKGQGRWIQVYDSGKLRYRQPDAPLSTEDLLAEDWELA